MCGVSDDRCLVLFIGCLVAAWLVCRWFCLRHYFCRSWQCQASVAFSVQHSHNLQQITLITTNARTENGI